MATQERSAEKCMSMWGDENAFSSYKECLCKSFLNWTYISTNACAQRSMSSVASAVTPKFLILSSDPELETPPAHLPIFLSLQIRAWYSSCESPSESSNFGQFKGRREASS